MIKKCSYFIVAASAVAGITMAFKGLSTTLVNNEYYRVRQPLPYTVPNVHETESSKEENAPKEAFSLETSNSFIAFKEALAQRESDGNYQSVNSYGYIGKYQFGKQTLRFLGVKNIQKFLKQPELQEKAFVAYVQKNKWILRREIRKYVGKKINGIYISEAGMIAAAHLGGAGSVQDYLRSNGQIAFTDGYGTNIKTYLKAFSKYDISDIKAEKNPKIAS